MVELRPFSQDLLSGIKLTENPLSGMKDIRHSLDLWDMYI